MKVDIEKAIEMLKGHKKYVSDVLYESIDLAVETLEKQIPQKPNVRYDNEFTDADGNRGMRVKYIECPNCESELGYDTDYCSSCGQRIECEVENV